MLSSLQDSISGHKGTIEVTIKRHISISFTAGDISVVMPSPSNHPPPTRNVVPLGRAVAIPLGCGGSQAPHRVEIVPLFLEAFFTSSEVLRHSSGTSQLLTLLEDFFHTLLQVLRHSSWTSMLLSLSTGSTTSPGCSSISPDFRGYLQERLLWRPGVHLVTFLDLWLDGHWLPRRLLISLVLAHFARSNPREAAVPSVYVVVSALYTCITAIFTQGLGPDHLFKTRAFTPTQLTSSKILFASTSAYYFSFVFSWPHKARVLGARAVKSTGCLAFQLVIFYVLCWYPFI